MNEQQWKWAGQCEGCPGGVHVDKRVLTGRKGLRGLEITGGVNTPDPCDLVWGDKKRKGFSVISMFDLRGFPGV